MSSTTQYGCGFSVDPDAPTSYNNTIQVAKGVYFTLQIAGEKELTDQGSKVEQTLVSALKDQVEKLDSQRYVFTHQVERTITVLDGDDEFTATLSFRPTRPRDLRNGKSELTALNALDRALALVHQTITAQATFREVLETMGPLGAVLAMAMD